MNPPRQSPLALRATRQPSAARPAGSRRLSPGEEVERFTVLLEELLQHSGYTDYGLAKNGEDKTHRLVRRLQMRSRDAAVWTGMLRQILWKLKNP